MKTSLAQLANNLGNAIIDGPLGGHTAKSLHDADRKQSHSIVEGMKHQEAAHRARVPVYSVEVFDGDFLLDVEYDYSPEDKAVGLIGDDITIENVYTTRMLVGTKVVSIKEKEVCEAISDHYCDLLAHYPEWAGKFKIAVRAQLESMRGEG